MCWLAGDTKQQQALPVLVKKSIFAPNSNQPPSVWRAVKLIYPYQIAAFIPPLITATILPMCMSSQVGQVRVRAHRALAFLNELCAVALHTWQVTDGAEYALPCVTDAALDWSCGLCQTACSNDVVLPGAHSTPLISLNVPKCVWT